MTDTQVKPDVFAAQSLADERKNFPLTGGEDGWLGTWAVHAARFLRPPARPGDAAFAFQRPRAKYKIVVQHDWYGCDNGCCGTSATLVETSGEDEYDKGREFDFGHMNKDEARQFAEKTQTEHGGNWIGAAIEIGELRCYDEQFPKDAIP